ncbi:multiple coagulation factor deficiency protein 2 homolog [Tubulanus polymorphus]|uniref:multiple coagulation factor deficiency protein 2 homolog n=1 Tax=Tubulanus polymorphus TaxID=672921 RepID=UPI003DA48EE0
MGHSGHHTRRQRGESSQDRDNKFHDPKVIRDKEHIQEHYDGKAAVNTSEMTDEELEFHYFKLHDLDNNTKLDGLEILHAISHMLPYDEEVGAKKPDLKGKTAEEVQKLMEEHKEQELKYYTDIIDRVLEDDDIDNDGYLTYLEYVLARRRDEAQHQKAEQGKQ